MSAFGMKADSMAIAYPHKIRVIVIFWRHMCARPRRVSTPAQSILRWLQVYSLTQKSIFLPRFPYEFCEGIAAIVYGGVSRPDKGAVSNWYRCDHCGHFSVRDFPFALACVAGQRAEFDDHQQFRLVAEVTAVVPLK